MKGARLIWLEGRSQLLRATEHRDAPLIPAGAIVQWRTAPLGSYYLESIHTGAVYAVVPCRQDAQALVHAQRLTSEWRAGQWW